MARNKDKQNGFKLVFKYLLWIGGVILGCGLLAYLFVFMPLWLLDVKHAELSGIVERITQRKHYFKGEVWFAALASCITALPGIFCGAFALLQTHRLSKLEARYHRPVLLLREATLKIWKPKGFDTSDDSVDFEDYIEQNKETHDVLIKLELEFEVKNEVEVKTFEIDSLTWKTSTDCYKVGALKKSRSVQLYDQKDFWREYKGDRIICHVEKHLEFDELKVNNFEQFESAVERFANFEQRKNDDYKRPEVILVAYIEYEYSKEKKEKLECRMQWDAQRGCESPKAFYTVHKTCDGYFSYDINSEK